MAESPRPSISDPTTESAPVTAPATVSHILGIAPAELQAAVMRVRAHLSTPADAQLFKTMWRFLVQTEEFLERRELAQHRLQRQAEACGLRSYKYSGAKPGGWHADDWERPWPR